MVYTDRKDISSRQKIHVNKDGTTPVYISSDPKKMPYPQNCINVKGQGDFFFYFRVYAPTQDYFDKKWTLPDINRIR